MTRNVGNIDRVIRVIIGVALLSLLFVLEGNLRWIGLIGLVPLLTALVGNCPLYSLVGLSTCPLRTRSSK
ncbi:YgaP family membrane protein [Ancylobacter sp. VNQ12]|uniref:YgaP family membrane protein n=1 Tax=Ancylobacter sp. VNQ12 TaxID=3400920 RepID=UPI003C0A6D35